MPCDLAALFSAPSAISKLRERRQIFARRGNLGARTAEPLAATRNLRTARQSSRVHRRASLRSILSHRCVLRRCLHDACKTLHWSPCLVVGECLWAFDLRFIDPQHEVLDSLQHLRCEQAPRNAPRPRCPAAAMPPPMQGQRNAASPGSARGRQEAVHGALDAHCRGGRVVLLQSFVVGELLVIEGHQASDEASFHVIHRNQAKLGIHLQRSQWRHWATVVHLAMRHFPVQRFRCDNRQGVRCRHSNSNVCW